MARVGEIGLWTKTDTVSLMAAILITGHFSHRGRLPGDSQIVNYMEIAFDMYEGIASAVKKEKQPCTNSF